MSPQLAFHENVGQPCESLFFLPSESENRIENSRFFLVSMTLKKACRFSIFEKITDVSKIINLGTNWTIFSKADDALPLCQISCFQHISLSRNIDRG